VWYPDPNHPYNHAAPDQPAVAEVKDSTGRLEKINGRHDQRGEDAIGEMQERYDHLVGVRPSLN
jgi:hypothetical protein